ncbi:hypothetical protein BDN70DRAFT_898806 [Pholiota conissans]|uniref:Uncharacterized protein n=1 Tax=Pholiota conissans TaxID=109636 RepID=A0A9P5YTV2_9AGAR|nr:hypothetical protein BDN70DRAFT_898806 [Pholiota conissans]
MHAIKAANKCFKALVPAKQGRENVKNLYHYRAIIKGFNNGKITFIQSIWYSYEVYKAIATATSMLLSCYFLKNSSKDQPPYNSHLLSILYQLSVEILNFDIMKLKLSLLNLVQHILLQLEDNEKPHLQQHVKVAKLMNIADYNAVSKAIPYASSVLDKKVMSILSPKAKVIKPREPVIVLDHNEDISTSGAVLEKNLSKMKEKGKATGK